MGKNVYRLLYAQYKKYPYAIGAGTLFVLLLVVGGMVSYHREPLSLDVVCNKGSIWEKNDCWERNLKKMVVEYDVSTALLQLRNLFDTSEYGPSSYCHALAHVIGSEAYKVFTVQKNFLYSPEMSNCTYGFYHGFIESMLAQTGDYGGVKRFCKQIVMGEDPRGLRAECFHGVGHGVVDRHVPGDWKYPKQIVDRSLEVCASMADAEIVHSVRNCIDGVYSGVRTVYFFGEYKVTLAPEHVLDLCKGGPTDNADICYNYMSTIFLPIAHNDFLKGLSLATAYTEPQYQGVTVGAVAATWATANMFTEPQKTWSTCRTLPVDLQYSCIAGYARGLVQNSKPGNEYIPSLEFCSQDGLGDTEVENCFKATQGELQRKYSPVALGEFCEKYAPSQVSICTKILSQ
jgi:hypothetical protein